MGFLSACVHGTVQGAAHHGLGPPDPSLLNDTVVICKCDIRPSRPDETADFAPLLQAALEAMRQSAEKLIQQHSKEHQTGDPALPAALDFLLVDGNRYGQRGRGHSRVHFCC